MRTRLSEIFHELLGLAFLCGVGYGIYSLYKLDDRFKNGWPKVLDAQTMKMRDVIKDRVKPECLKGEP